MSRIRVLLVEEDVAFVQRVQRALSMQDALKDVFDVHPVNCLTDALKSLQAMVFNIVLLDLNLPDSSGLDTLDAIHTKNHELPIVVLAGAEHARVEKEALKRGAQQCLHKSNLGGLLEAMRLAVKTRLHGPGKVQPEVEGLLNDLDESIEASKQAISKLDTKRTDPAEHDAVQALGSHLGKMQSRISAFRKDGK